MIIKCINKDHSNKYKHSEMLMDKDQFKKELKRTQMTLMKVMSDNKKLSIKNSQYGSYAKGLRLKIADAKKEILAITAEYICKNVKLQNKVVKMKKEIKILKNSLKNVMFDDNNDVVVEDIVDLTQPQTPPKPKRNNPVSLNKKVQKKLIL